VLRSGLQKLILVLLLAGTTDAQDESTATVPGELLPTPNLAVPTPALISPSVIDTAPSVATNTPGVVATPLATGGSNDTSAIRRSGRSLDDFWGYRVSESSTSWTVGDGDQFGSFWLHPNPYLNLGVQSGMTVGLGIGFLAGPERTDMPPRLFDFSIGYQRREVLGNVAYDVSTSVLAASDFEGSSRDGIRFPAHAVGYVTLTRRIDLVLGVDYLDRDDIRILPVGGLLLRPDSGMRLEIVFPRPRIELEVAPGRRMYLRGGLGGGTWAVERDSELDDLASLYELQLGIGLSRKDDDGDWSSLELVYLFDRKLEYASGLGDYDIGPTLMVRAITQH
jgi:hypothetical protein